MPEKHDVAVLVGDGPSIAFNQDLNLRAITEEEMQRMKNANRDEAVLAMKMTAERTLPEGVTSDEDFESYGIEEFVSYNADTRADYAQFLPAANSFCETATPFGV